MAIAGVNNNNYYLYVNQNNGDTGKAYSNVRDYKAYLSEKYECMKNSNYSVEINSSLLDKATSDEKTSKWLEYNLSLIPKVVDDLKSAAAARGSKLLSCNISMNGYDNMTTEVVTQVEVDLGTEKAKKELEEKIKKTRAEKRAEDKRTQKKQQEKRLEEKAADRYSQTNADTKHTVVEAGSVDELVKKIAAANWNEIRAEGSTESGGRFDFSI